MFNPILAAMQGVDAIKEITKGSLSNAYEGFPNQFSETSPKTPWLSLGPGLNELADNYSYGTGSHNFRLLKYVSPDIMLVHQSRMVGFYIKMGKSRELKPVSRDIKNLLLRDVRY